MTFLAFVVVAIASFYILLTQGLAVLAARRSGVLIGRSPAKVRIERAIDPEYFDELLYARTRVLRLPAFVAVAAIAILSWTIFAVVSVFSGGLAPPP